MRPRAIPTWNIDLDTGKRGSRLVHAEALLQRLHRRGGGPGGQQQRRRGLLVLTALASRRAVVIARSQLVEIGGGFRVPDVMKQSGASLLEIGTTNRVHLADYEQALAEERPALVMRAHRSNFRILGFTSEPDWRRSAAARPPGAACPWSTTSALARCSIPPATAWPTSRPSQESLAAGADLVCFSGDKLLGGPQAGIIVGRAELVARLKKHPLARAIRADKLCLAALSATLLHYLKDEAEREVPVWRMISTPPEILRQRAEAWAAQLGQRRGGRRAIHRRRRRLPGETLPTFALALRVPSPNRFMEKLRRSSPPLIARLEDELVSSIRAPCCQSRTAICCASCRNSCPDGN